MQMWIEILDRLGIFPLLVTEYLWLTGVAILRFCVFLWPDSYPRTLSLFAVLAILVLHSAVSSQTRFLLDGLNQLNSLLLLWL